MPKIKGLYRNISTAVIMHKQDRKKPMEKAVRDALIAVRQLAEVHGVSYADASMDAHEVWAMKERR